MNRLQTLLWNYGYCVADFARERNGPRRSWTHGRLTLLKGLLFSSCYGSYLKRPTREHGKWIAKGCAAYRGEWI